MYESMATPNPVVPDARALVMLSPTSRGMNWSAILCQGTKSIKARKGNGFITRENMDIGDEQGRGTESRSIYGQKGISHIISTNENSARGQTTSLGGINYSRAIGKGGNTKINIEGIILHRTPKTKRGIKLSRLNL